MHVNKEKANVSIWLAKLPPFLTTKIKELTGEKTIGEIIMVSPNQLQFKLGMDLISLGMPTEYTISITNREERSYVLVEDGIDYDIAGYINKEVFIKPVLDNKYFCLLKQNSQNEAVNKVRIIDYSREGKQCERFGSVGELDYLARRRKRLLQAKKRERLDKAEVIDLIFKAYEKHESWTVRDLADFCGQPVAYIQEILPEICSLNKKDYRNLYELKPEYKQL